MTFTTLARQRYSVRAFQQSPVEREKLQKIVEAANCAPTATNAQPFHIWAVCSGEAVRKVNETTQCGFGAPAFLVLGTKPAQAWTREEDGYNFSGVDGGLVGAHILFAAQEQGLGATWVGRVDPAKLAERFPEMRGYDILGIFPVGYPAGTKAGQPGPLHKERKPLEEILDFI